MINTDLIAENLRKAIGEDNAIWHNPIGKNTYPVVFTNGKDNKLTTEVNNLHLENVKAVKGFKSNRWIMHKDLKKNNIYVKKGQKGSYITNKNDGSKICVFNVDQLELPQDHYLVTVPETKEFEKNLNLEKIIKFTGVNVIEEDVEKSYYDINKNEIHIAKRESYSSSTAFYTSVMHEIAHYSSVKLGTTISSDMNSDMYAKEEIIAEITSYMLASSNGIPYSALTNNAVYIKTWLNQFEEDEINKILSECIVKASENVKLINTLSAENKKFEERSEDIVELDILTIEDFNNIKNLGAFYSESKKCFYIDTKIHDIENFRNYITKSITQQSQQENDVDDIDQRESLNNVYAINSNSPNDEYDLPPFDIDDIPPFEIEESVDNINNTEIENQESNQEQNLKQQSLQEQEDSYSDDEQTSEEDEDLTKSENYDNYLTQVNQESIDKNTDKIYTDVKEVQNVSIQNVNNYNEEEKDARFENKLESVSTDRSQDSGSGGFSEISEEIRRNDNGNVANDSEVRPNERGTGSNESSLSRSTKRQDRDQDEEKSGIESNSTNDSIIREVGENQGDVRRGATGVRVRENVGSESYTTQQNGNSNSNNSFGTVQSDGYTTYLSNGNGRPISVDPKRTDWLENTTSSDLGGFNTETNNETNVGTLRRGEDGRSGLSEQSGERHSNAVEQLGDSTNGRTIQESRERGTETIRNQPLSGDNRGNREGSVFNERGEMVVEEDRIFNQESSETIKRNAGERRTGELFNSDRRTSGEDVSSSSNSIDERDLSERTGEISGNERVNVGRKSSLFTDLYANNKLDKSQLSGVPVDFVITDQNLGEGTPKEKFANNIAAIKVLQQLENEKRYATDYEQVILSRYVGWGGLSNAFNSEKPEWKNEYNELKNLLSSDEWDAARLTTLTSFYTSPVVIENMYKTLERMNFNGGYVLEPGCGVGNFLGKMPESLARNSSRTGIELDSISARIASFLYPKSEIMIAGYQEIDSSKKYDVVIGNVPFSDIKVHDKDYRDLSVNQGLKQVKIKPSLHNYFFVKSIDKVKEGGVIALITSSSTMDSKNDAVRQYLAKHCEFLGAVRLPNTTFKKNAGTEVISDIIFLKKRTEIQFDLRNEPWINSVASSVDSDCNINAYFESHPEMIVGDLKASTNQYGKSLTVDLEPELLNQELQAKLSLIEGQFNARESNDVDKSEEKIKSNFSRDEIGTFVQEASGIYYIEDEKTKTRVDLSKTQMKKLLQFMDLVKAYDDIIDIQLTGCTDEDLKEQQENLKNVYDSFTEKGDKLISVSRSFSFLKKDYRFNKIRALEKIKDGKLLSLSDIFTKRTINAKSERSIRTINDAIYSSLIETGAINFDFISGVLNKEKQECFDEIKDRLYRLPESESNDLFEDWVLAEDYLSGDIYEKLLLAEEKAKQDPAFERNVEALKNVLPERIPLKDIGFNIGSAWLPKDIVNRFIQENYGSGFNVREVAGRFVVGFDNNKHNYISEQYENREALCLDKGRPTIERVCDHLNHLLSGQEVTPPKFSDNTSEMKKIRTIENVEKVNLHLEEMRKKFKNSILSYENPKESVLIEEIFNQKFNGYVNREYTGANLDFAEKSSLVTLRPHQISAVERMLIGGNTLLAHEVGAGKTYEMIAAAMEGKRLGLTNKNLIVVPKAVIGQFATSIQHLYPKANVLMLDDIKNLNQKEREVLTSRIASGNYDIVLITHDQLKKMSLSSETQNKYLEKKLNEIQEFLEANPKKGDNKFIVDLMEKYEKFYTNKIEELKEDKDKSIPFEKLGIDRIFVDEAHLFKNLLEITENGHVKGVSLSNAERSINLTMITNYLNEKYGDSRVVLATGTPISNNITEMYVMMRYVCPNLLDKLNIKSLDSFIYSFCKKETDMELTATGEYKKTERIKSFENIPELMKIARQSWDIKTMKELDYIKLPKSKTFVVDVPASETQKKFFEEIKERALAIKNKKVKPDEDNMLKITNDGKKIAIDSRLYDPFAPSDSLKIAKVCENVARIYKDDPNNLDTQLIMSDIGIPNAAKSFTVYDEIKSQLVDFGIPEDQIAFIHDFEKEDQKANLFDKVNKGEIRVLLGSTGKLGTGVNVQENLKAIHHVDVPWRPSDVAQRNGRIVRQGNKHEEVEIYHYVTEGSFDSFMYQTLRNKSNFTNQILRPVTELESREIEIDDRDSLTFEEAMAASADDDRLAVKYKLEKEIKKLNLMKKAHNENLLDAQDKLRPQGAIQRLLTSAEKETNELMDLKVKSKLDEPAEFNSYGQVVDYENLNNSIRYRKETMGVEADYLPRVGLVTYRNFRLRFKCVNNTDGKERYIISTHTNGLDIRVNVNGNSKTWGKALDKAIVKAMETKDKDIQTYRDNAVRQKERCEQIVKNPDFAKEKELNEKLASYDELLKIEKAYSAEEYKKITRSPELYEVWKEHNSNSFIEEKFAENLSDGRFWKRPLTESDFDMARVKLVDVHEKARVYLSLPPEETREAVVKGAKYDDKNRAFYTTSDDKNFEEIKSLQDKENQKPKVYIPNTLYNERGELKQLGAKWDPNAKSWYINSNETKPKGFEKWFDKVESKEKTTEKIIPQHTYWINNAYYHEKEELKSLGAKWDPNAKSWYIKTDEIMPKGFEKWIDRESEKLERNNNFALETSEDAITEMLKDMRENGMIIDRHKLSFSGSLAKGRCSCEGDRSGEESGWYCIHLDGCPTLVMQNHKKESTQQVKKYPTKESLSRLKNISNSSRKNFTKQIVTEHQNNDKQHDLDKLNREKNYEQKSKLLTFEYANSKQAETKDSAYLMSKGVEATKGIYIKSIRDKQYTCIPFFNIDGKITTKQYIDEQGNKRFETGGKKAGSFHVINGFDMLNTSTAGIIIAEGYATANTVNEATNGKYSVIAAGDCGNLENVAKAIRSKYPNKDIIIAADNDHIREDNVGLKHATQAAKNVGAMLVYPSFSFGVKASDFNDLKKISGIEVVRSSIREQLLTQISNAKKLQQEHNNSRRIN